MIWDYQTILGILAAFVGVLGYVPYYRNILRGKTKPHPFSWIIFTLLMSIVFVGQMNGGGGPGAWVSGVSVVGIAGIAFLALKKGEKSITPFDWFCFVGALVGVLVLHVTNDPLTAIIVVTLVNLVAFAPTVRSGYRKPNQETASLFFFGTVKYLISLFALSTLSLTTTLFPLSVIVSNTFFVCMLLFRRTQLSKSARHTR
jgi:hypothetical protein